MDETSAEASAPEDGLLKVRRQRWRPRRWQWVTATVVLVACLVSTFVGWLILGERAADGVRVAWNVVSCKNTTTKADDAPSPTSRGELVIEVRPGMSCEVAVRITSDHRVRLRRMVAPYVGPQAPAGVVVDPDRGTWNSDAHASTSAAAIDATLAMDVEVGPDSPLTVHVPLVWSGDAACTDVGTFGAVGWPRVDFTAWGRSFTRSSGEDLLLEIPKRSTTGCP